MTASRQPGSSKLAGMTFKTKDVLFYAAGTILLATGAYLGATAGIYLYWLWRGHW